MRDAIEDVTRNRSPVRIALSTVAILLSFGASGCWLAAAQLAPVALQAVESLGSGVAQVAAAASGPRTPKDSDLTPAEQEERCDELEIEVPGVIEFRSSQSAPGPEWREIRLGGSMDSPQWEPLIEQDAGPGGWRQVANLATMNFTPPIDGALKPGADNYLAYAPANPQTSVEQDQLISMTIDFGAGIGTFQWKGRLYQYSLVRQLPCYPTSLAMN